MEFAAFFVLSALAAASAVSDVRTYEIPNSLCLLIAAGFAPLAFAAGLTPATIGLHYLAGLGCLAIGFALFQLRAFGGGDAKMLAAVAVWFGLAGAGEFLLSVAIAGGALAAMALFARRFAPDTPLPADRPAALRRFLQPGHGVPYGVAIAIGALLAWPHAPFGQV